MDMKKLEMAIETVQKGIADKVVVGRFTVYRCGKIIRVDIAEVR